MIALNWFEVLLPASTLQIQAEVFPQVAALPGAVRTLAHRTIIRRIEDRALRYHVTPNAIQGTHIMELSAQEDPGLIRSTLEHGFGLRLAAATFGVRMKKVGGSGYRDTGQSLHPDLYHALEGIRFRGFFFAGDPGSHDTRWGLVLNYITGQRFAMSLADDRLAQIAIGRQVIPYLLTESDEEPSVSEAGARLVELRGSNAVLESGHGELITVARNDWTLPGSKRYVLSAAELLFGPRSAQAISFELQRAALTLTAERRMNTQLARSQHERLRALLHEFQLLSFTLPLPDAPTVRVSDQPLKVH